MKSYLVPAIILGCTLAACGGESGGASFWPPGKYGPHRVGFRELDIYDEARGRKLTTAVWYPALSTPTSAETVRYLSLVEGRAREGLDLKTSAAPYPLVLFSHGNQGISVQSFTLCEHLASQGFVVAAPNHEGNTLMDNPSDAEMAQLALERPLDIVFVANRLLKMSSDDSGEWYGFFDPGRIAVVGHSFGGYTTLVLGGGRVDRDVAVERCQNDRSDDVMCPYLQYWPEGSVIERPSDTPRFGAAVALAPGGYGAFGPEGIAEIDVPTMVMGGDLDEFTASDIMPIYDSLPHPRAMVEIAGAGHMSFTDICRAGLPVPELEQMCDPEKFIDIDRAFEITDTFTTAWLRRYLNDERAMEEAAESAAEEFREADLVVDWN